MSTGSGNLTLDLNCWAEGGSVDVDLLFDRIYRRLKTIAKSCLRRESPDALQQTTALVHEAYLNLGEPLGLQWNNREHFFAFVARLMRRVLVDQARLKSRAKRGSQVQRVSLDGLDPWADPGLSDPARGRDEVALDILDLHRALGELAAIDPGMARLVELRYFCGFSVLEIATLLDTSESTIFRQWRFARAWLYDALFYSSRA